MAKQPRRRRLPSGDYFRLKGNRDQLPCDCTDRDPFPDLFRCSGPIEPQTFHAKFDPDWPNQLGTFGSLSPFDCPFVTATMANMIADAFPNEVQFLELKIRKSAEEWRVMKVLNYVKCFLWEESDQQQRLILNRDAIGSHNIFFVRNYYEGLEVFVSRPVAQLFYSQNVLGVLCSPVTTISPTIQPDPPMPQMEQ